MPKIFRAMQEVGGLPKTGETARTLGVRVPADIQPDGDGMVEPGPVGMSVAPSLCDLPTHRIPRRLRRLAPDATGNDSDFVWSMGSGPFHQGSLCDLLLLYVDSSNHGL